MDNAVLFAAGSCWEGVDFPGDMVSSLIIVKLPFAVPDPISEAQKKEYASLKDYIQAVIVPDMQKKLRQGFGRALRTETDTCVVSILDERAGEDGRYHEEVMCALPKLQDGKRHQGCPAFYQKPERRGILPVTVRGSATENSRFYARNVWWYFWGVFGGIGGIAE